MKNMKNAACLIPRGLVAAGLLAPGIAGLSGSCKAEAAPLSRAFELRALSADPKADGETDFKGPTAVFGTDERIGFLGHYAGYAKRFFEDPNLDTEVVTDAAVGAAVRALKPQPLPEVRRRVPLVDWKFLGSRPGQRAEEARELEMWRARRGVTVTNGALAITADQTVIEHEIPAQSWRFFLQWRVRPAAAPATFALSEAVRIDFDGRGRLTRRTAEIMPLCPP